MPKQRVQAIKFQKTNKASVKGRVGHSRTGACPSKTGKCQCPRQDSKQ